MRRFPPLTYRAARPALGSCADRHILCYFLMFGVGLSPACDPTDDVPRELDDEGSSEATDDDETALGGGGEGAIGPTDRMDARAAEPRDAQSRDARGLDAANFDAGTVEYARDAGSPEEASARPVNEAGFNGIDAAWGATLPPFETHGSPLPGSMDRWTYTEFPESQCRDGSPAGVSVNLGTSDNVMIFFEGGGFCIDEQTCATNPADVFLQIAAIELASAGLFDRDNPANPVGDWNFVYIPYCTGDRHGGANPDGDVPGVGPQRFVGHLNVQKFLDRIVPTFPRASVVLVTGQSAGGFGSIKNALLVQRAFSTAQVRTIDDSGPLASNAVLAICTQETWRTLWRLDQTILADCAAACPDENDYWQDYGVFLATALRAPVGLISSTEDWVERALFGIGNDGCTGALDFFNPGVSGAALRADLLVFRERVRPLPNFNTFFIEEENPETLATDREIHTWIASDDFYVAEAGGVKLVDWFAEIVDGDNPGHAGP